MRINCLLDYHETKYVEVKDMEVIMLKKNCKLLDLKLNDPQEGEREQALGYEKIGNVSDKYRQVIFSLFESRYQISKSELRDAIHQQLQTTLTSKEYHGITSVLCDSPTTYKSGHWVLRVKRNAE